MEFLSWNTRRINVKRNPPMLDTSRLYSTVLRTPYFTHENERMVHALIPPPWKGLIDFTRRQGPPHLRRITLSTSLVLTPIRAHRILRDSYARRQNVAKSTVLRRRGYDCGPSFYPSVMRSPAGQSFANATAGRTHMSEGWSTESMKMGVAIRREGLRRDCVVIWRMEEGSTLFLLFQVNSF